MSSVFSTPPVPLVTITTLVPLLLEFLLLIGCVAAQTLQTCHDANEGVADGSFTLRAECTSYSPICTRDNYTNPQYNLNCATNNPWSYKGMYASEDI